MQQPKSQYHYPLKCPTGRWTLLATILASAMAFIDATALNVILPTLQKELNATGSDLFWVLNSYLLMLAALIILGGSLGDKLGRVKIFKTGILVFTLGSVLCGIAPNIFSLIIFRALQGLGGALMIPGSLAIISATFAPEEKGKAIGSWSAITTIVTVSGPVIGGTLADIGLWRYIFYLNVPLGLFAFWILQQKVPESRESGSSKIDWPGAILLTFSLASFTYGFLGMPEWGYNHPLILASIALGIIGLFLFIRTEQKSNSPMVPMSVFKNRTFAGINLLTFFLYAALGGMMLFLSLNIIQIQGYSQLQAGLTFLPFSALMVSLARTMGKATDKYGARVFLIIGPLITGIGLFWLAMIGLTDGPSDYWTTFFPPFIIFAAGMSITVVPLTTAVMTSISENKSGIASGINNSITRIAGTFMNAIIGAFAVILFVSFVEADLLNSNTFSFDVRETILQEANKLGDAKPPESIHTKLKDEVQHIYTTSFLKTYRMVGILCAILAFISSAIALFMIKSEKS